MRDNMAPPLFMIIVTSTWMSYAAQLLATYVHMTFCILALHTINFWQRYNRPMTNDTTDYT